MRIISAHLYALRIPFTMPFSHKLATRSYSDSVIVKLTADNGETGFGEGIPRPYVTGETVSSCLDHIRRVLIPVIERHNPHLFSMNAHPMTQLSEISRMLPDGRADSVIAFNAARAAAEIALLDTLLKESGKSLGSLITPFTDSITYSAIITADSVDNAGKIALICRRCRNKSGESQGGSWG
jgi:L-Ala-D/L-Glu epimerase / N-acetyl-D-glutamate racemase